jgi:hypothetical protein
VEQIEHIDEDSARYEMEISAEKTKLITNSLTDIRVKGGRLETVNCF